LFPASIVVICRTCREL